MQTVGTSDRDNLITGDFPLVTTSLEIGANQTFDRGAAVGIVTADGLGAQVDDDASDGSETLYGIAAEDVNTGAGETKTITVYLTGQFNINEITFASGTAAAYKSAARALSIYFEDVVTQ